jgi:hypothetical protein
MSAAEDIEYDDYDDEEVDDWMPEQTELAAVPPHVFATLFQHLAP